MNPENSTLLNSSQLYDVGLMERKRYGQMNSASDIFNVKEANNANNKKDVVENASSRRYQYHHYQSACPYGRDDITVDNPHKVHAIYQESPNPMAMTEPSYEHATEMAATEPSSTYPSQPMPRSREGRRRHEVGGGPASAASNGIERHEDIFVSREDLQTPEQRKEALLKRQQLNQLLNNDTDSSEPKKNFAAPYATSFDLSNKRNANAEAGPKPLSSTVSVSSLAPFATIDYNPYENYTNARRAMATTDELKAQAQEYQHFISHEPDFSVPPPSQHLHNHPHENYPPPTLPQDHPLPHHHHYEGEAAPAPSSPYFHETSSRHIPRDLMKEEVCVPRELLEEGAPASAPWKGKEVEKEDLGLDRALPSSSSSGVNPGHGLSKDHITSSFDKATALSDRDYFNSIMNDPHYHQQHNNQGVVSSESPEDALNREKYEQAKNRFDELYRDIMNTEDLKNHPELIEELKKISPTDLENYAASAADAATASAPPPRHQPPAADLSSPSPFNPGMAPPPPSTQMNGQANVNVNAAGKDDYMHSLEDLDKKLEKFSLEAGQDQANKPPALAPAPAPVQAPAPTEPMPAAMTEDAQGRSQNQSRARMNRRNFNESHIFDGLNEDTKPKAKTPPANANADDPNMSATAKARLKASNSYNNIFGTPEYHAEAEKKAQESRRQYNRRHWKLAQQNHSDIFCLGGDTATAEQKLMASEVGHTELPPEVPTTVDRRASQLNLLTSRDNPMCTTYSTMCRPMNPEDRQKLAEQPAFGLSSVQSHRTYKSKSRKFSPANTSQISF